MTERKPKNQSWEGFSEQQILSAQQAGAFDNLPGAGRPIPGIDEPLDDNWWVRQKLREEKANLLPPLLEARRDIEQTRREIRSLSSESHVRSLLLELQSRVDTAIRSPVPSPPVVVLPVDVEEELERWRAGK